MSCCAGRTGYVSPLLERPFSSALVPGSSAPRRIRQDFRARHSRPGGPAGSRSPVGHVVWGKGRFGLRIIGLPSMCLRCAVSLPARGGAALHPRRSDGPSPTKAGVVLPPQRVCLWLSLLSLLSLADRGGHRHCRALVTRPPNRVASWEVAE